MKTVALIAAAGRGQRMGGQTAKQFLPLAGAPVLRHVVRIFTDHPRIDAVRVVIHPDDRAAYEAAVAGLDVLAPAVGGAERQSSVRLGLESLAASPPEHILIHDAARLPSPALIDRVLGALTGAPGAIPALPVADTIKRGQDGKVTGTVARTGLYRAQTPQGFEFKAILAAHQAAGPGLTDDAAVLEATGKTVALVAGEEDNFKLTTPDDLARARRILLARCDDIRTGLGFDVHRFGAGDHVMLCGVAISHTHGLAGHSDADVGLHALTDALLGALGAGDIGEHFPPDDPRWRGAASAVFARHAAGLITERGGLIAHVDVTLICERPKIGPHRAAMVAALAGLLSLDAGRVSIKATTSEKLGFTGRGEGIAAQAIATIRLPA